MMLFTWQTLDLGLEGARVSLTSYALVVVHQISKNMEFKHYQLQTNVVKLVNNRPIPDAEKP